MEFEQKNFLSEEITRAKEICDYIIKELQNDTSLRDNQSYEYENDVFTIKDRLHSWEILNSLRKLAEVNINPQPEIVNKLIIFNGTVTNQEGQDGSIAIEINLGANEIGIAVIIPTP